MKRIISLFLVLSLVGTLLVGCNVKSKDTAKNGKEPEVVLEFGHIQNPGHALYVAPEEFKELVEKKSNGRIKINLYPASQLGSAREMMEQISMGSLDITFADASDWASTFNRPELGVFNLPFLCNDLDAQCRIIENIVPKEVPKMIKGLDFHLLMTYSNGLRCPLVKTRPIHKLEDIKGLKMRTPETKLYVDIWNALGASTVTSAWSEAYTLLQQGVADAVEADDVGLTSQNLQEVGKYFTKTNYLSQAYLVMINNEKWNSIPKDLQKILLDCAKENQAKQLKDRKELGVEAEKTIAAAGVKIYDLDPKERQRMKDACKSIYDQYANEYGLGKLIKQMEAI